VCGYPDSRVVPLFTTKVWRKGVLRNPNKTTQMIEKMGNKVFQKPVTGAWQSYWDASPQYE
jgi:hypothetical protein